MSVVRENGRKKFCELSPRSSASTERKVSVKETEDDESGLGELTVSWQEKKFSPAEIQFYSAAKEDDFHGDVLKMKFFRDVQVSML
jgi:hypothetical protein